MIKPESNDFGKFLPYIEIVTPSRGKTKLGRISVITMGKTILNSVFVFEQSPNSELKIAEYDPPIKIDDKLP